MGYIKRGLACDYGWGLADVGGCWWADVGWRVLVDVGGGCGLACVGGWVLGVDVGWRVLAAGYWGGCGLAGVGGWAGVEAGLVNCNFLRKTSERTVYKTRSSFV